jgi:hypothetical protein
MDFSEQTNNKIFSKKKDQVTLFSICSLLTVSNVQWHSCVQSLAQTI